MKCNTPIDPETKIALVGEALEAALKDLNSPRCGHELSADDMFCPACGAKVDRARLDGGFDSNGEPAPILERINGYSWKRVLVRVGYLLGGVACIGIIILGIVLMKNFRVYSFGLFLIMPLFAAIQCWRLAFNNDLARADNGDPVGLFNVGVALYKGEVKVDVLDNSVIEGESTAFDYFMRAAMKGNAQGMFNVAYCSETGVGCEQDKLRALEWYRKAAENGISEAARHAARLEREMSARNAMAPLPFEKRDLVMTIVRIMVVSAVSLAALVALSASAVQHYYCKYCGLKSTSIASLTSSKCQRHPSGPAKGRHEPAL